MFSSDRLHKRRIDMGMTLEEVGNIVGISRSAVQKYEKRVIKNVYVSTVELFAKALHCSPAYLIGWTDDPKNYECSEDYSLLSDHEKQVISYYRANSAMQPAVDKLLGLSDEEIINKKDA